MTPLQIFFPPSEIIMKNFKQAFRRNASDRFIVTILYKENLYDLGKSLEIALNRLFMVQRKLKKQSRFKGEIQWLSFGIFRVRPHESRGRNRGQS